MPPGSWAGGPRARRTRDSCSTRWSRLHDRFIAAGSCKIATGAANTYPYSEFLVEVGIESSVGGVGDSYDNALAETINGLDKAEVIHRRGPWRSFEAVEFATLEWVDWFNNRRIPPVEVGQRYYAILEQPAIAA